MLENYLEIIKAEKEFQKQTQKFIVEEIDDIFCYDIIEKVQNGLDSYDALAKTIEEYGYHLKDELI